MRFSFFVLTASPFSSDIGLLASVAISVCLFAFVSFF